MSSILVFDIGGTKCDVGVFDQQGNILKKERIIAEIHSDNKPILKQLSELTQKYTKLFSIDTCVFGIPGVVAYDRATIINSPNLLGIRNINLVTIFREKFPGIDFLVENDANLFTLGGYAASNYKPEVFLGLTIGSGIGGGVVVNQRLLKGKDSLVGEFGHTVIDYNGKQCYCGHKGCWEQYASALALIQKVKTSIKANPDIQTSIPKENPIMDHLVAALVKKDDFALKVLNENVDFLSIGLANIINSFDPGVIILGGSLGNLLGFYYNNLVEKINTRLVGNEMKCQIYNPSDAEIQLKGGYYFAKYNQD